MTSALRTTAGVIAIYGLGAVALQVWLGVSSNPGRTVGYEIWRLARFFTILTQVISVIIFARIALTGRVHPFWSGAITLWISIVAIVYHALLARELSGLRLLNDHNLHSILPVLIVLWWLAFAPKSGLHWHHAAWWAAWPAVYAVYALVRGTFDGRYPYFFLDPVKQGWDGVLGWVVGMGTGFALGGLALVALAKLMARRTGQSAPSPHM